MTDEPKLNALDRHVANLCREGDDDEGDAFANIRDRLRTLEAASAGRGKLVDAPPSSEWMDIAAPPASVATSATALDWPTGEGGTMPGCRHEGSGARAANFCERCGARLHYYAPPASVEAEPDPAAGAPIAVLSAGYMNDPRSWCYWDEEYPDEGSVGPFDTRDQAVRHAEENGYRVETVVSDAIARAVGS